MTDRLVTAYATSRKAGREALIDAVGSGAANLGSLVSAIGGAPGEGGSWFALAEGLLVLLRAHSDQWDAVLEDLGNPECDGRVEDIATVLGPHLADAVSSSVGTAAALRITEEVDALLSDGEPEVLVVAALLRSVDAARSTTFTAWCAVRGEVVIEPGVAYPVAVADPRVLMAESANTAPWKEPSLSVEGIARRVRLGAPLHGTYRVTLSWGLRDVLARLDSGVPLGEGPRIGQSPSRRIATLHVHQSHEDFGFDDGPRGTVANLGPLDPATSAQQHVALVRACDAPSNDGVAHADIIVIPEYTITTEARSTIEAALVASTSVQLVVAGTASRPDHVNEGHIIFRSPFGTTGDRAVDELVARSTEKFAQAQPLGFKEAMTTRGRPAITIWRSGDLALAVLICRDAVDREALGLLVNAGVNVCLVPSFTNTLSNLARSLSRLASESQAWVALAAAPRTWRKGRVQHEAYFSGPFGDDVLRPDAYAPLAPEDGGGDAPPLPGAWVFDSRSVADLDEAASAEAGPRVRFLAGSSPVSEDPPRRPR